MTIREAIASTDAGPGQRPAPDLVLARCPPCNSQLLAVRVDSDAALIRDRHTWRVVCMACGAEGPRGVSRAAAVSLWNQAGAVKVAR